MTGLIKTTRRLIKTGRQRIASGLKTGLKTSLIASLITGLLVACGAKLTQENFDKVNIGMTTSEVKTILGDPNRVETVSIPIVGNVTKYTYTNEKSEVSIILQGDRVQTKAGTIVK